MRERDDRVRVPSEAEITEDPGAQLPSGAPVPAFPGPRCREAAEGRTVVRTAAYFGFWLA